MHLKNWDTLVALGWSAGVSSLTEKLENRVTVSTYVPPYQKEQWEEDAEEIGASLSEFIRMMVQAGRRSFDLSPQHVPRYELQDDVIAGLRAVPGLTWDEMIEALPPGASETDLESILESLQRSGGVVVRAGGKYELIEE